MNRLLLLLIVPFLLLAEETLSCTDEVLFSFFPESFTVEALEGEGVSKEQAEKIAKDLSKRDGEIIKRIEEKASSMAANPIQDPSAEKERAELFRSVISAVYIEALQRGGINDSEKSSKTLEVIQQKRLDRFEACRKAGKLP